MNIVLEANNHLADNSTEENISELFGHHGWSLESTEDELKARPFRVGIPSESKTRGWRGMWSRGHPLFVGSPYAHHIFIAGQQKKPT